MSEEFIEIQPEALSGNVFKLFGADWPLITAGNLKSYNSMTAGWGGFGVLWRRNVATIYVRPQRYTFQFLNKESFFSLSFFNEKYREVLNFFGSKSGKDVDKAKETGLTPVEFEEKTIYYKESDLVVILNKLYHQDFNPGNFTAIKPEEIYPAKDYHRIFIGEIVKILKKK